MSLHLHCISILNLVAITFFSLYVNSVSAFCFNDAGARYNIDPILLRSVAIRESALNPKAINSNKNKEWKITSHDYGLMQINSIHLDKLKSLGIIKEKNDLLNNPCLNVQIGAWILASHIQKCGVNWDCLGSYNAGFGVNRVSTRMHYARKIYKIYSKELNTGY